MKISVSPAKAKIVRKGDEICFGGNPVFYKVVYGKVKKNHWRDKISPRDTDCLSAQPIAARSLGAAVDPANG